MKRSRVSIAFAILKIPNFSSNSLIQFSFLYCHACLKILWPNKLSKEEEEEEEEEQQQQRQQQQQQTTTINYLCRYCNS